MRGPSSGFVTTATGITRLARIRFTMGESSLIVFCLRRCGSLLGQAVSSDPLLLRLSQTIHEVYRYLATIVPGRVLHSVFRPRKNMSADYVKIARLKDVPAFRGRLEELGLELPVDDEALTAAAGSPLAQPIEVSGVTVGNRWCIHPMEGWDANRDGSPTEYTIRRWRNFGLSGAKLIWGGEAAAVQPDGRANPNQTLATPENEDGLRQLLTTLNDAHAESFGSTDDLLVGLQLDPLRALLPSQRQGALGAPYRLPSSLARREVRDRPQRRFHRLDGRRSASPNRHLRRSGSACPKGRVSLRRRKGLPRLPPARVSFCPFPPRAIRRRLRGPYALAQDHHRPHSRGNARAHSRRASKLFRYRPLQDQHGNGSPNGFFRPLALSPRLRGGRKRPLATGPRRAPPACGRAQGSRRGSRQPQLRQPLFQPTRSAPRHLSAQRRIPTAGGSPRGRRPADKRRTGVQERRSGHPLGWHGLLPTCRITCRTSPKPPFGKAGWISWVLDAWCFPIPGFPPTCWNKAPCSAVPSAELSATAPPLLATACCQVASPSTLFTRSSPSSLG